MILAYHVIITAYGFWLPNDPRGSWSDFVRSWELAKFGDATKVTTHRSLARTPHSKSLRLAAKRALHYPPVSFTGRQSLAIAHGFQHAITRSRFTLHACSILPEHVHLVVARHTYPIERVRQQLKGEAAKSLRTENLHPFQTILQRNNQPHSPWADEAWDVYLDTPADIHRAIRYVEQNPIKEGNPPQHWPFTTPYPHQ
ncbi:MAG: transposase [Phycisphaerae bacterium]